MANFPKLKITNAGLSLLANVQVGADEITFTKTVIGDGELTTGAENLTDLISPKVVCAIKSGKKVGESTYQIASFFSNSDVSAGFWWREIGVFAKGKDGNEILYCYSNAGGAGDYIPVGSDERVEKYIYQSFAIGNAENVTAEINANDTFILMTEKGTAGGVAPLNADGIIDAEFIPHISDTLLHNRTRAGGGAIGIDATTDTYGGSIGYKATSKNGGAVGSNTVVENGGAVGNGARAAQGGALGYNTRTSDGVAIGANAKTLDASGNPIDAVQLGEGTNTEKKSFQVYDKKMMNADGKIPLERIPDSLKNKAPAGHGLGEQTPAFLNDIINMMSKGNGFYSTGNSTDSPKNNDAWLGVLQLVRTITTGKETGSQLVFHDFTPDNPQMWLRTIVAGKIGNWVEMIHSGNIDVYSPSKIETKTYVGTQSSWGTYNSVKVNFEKTPKMFTIYGKVDYFNHSVVVPWGVPNLTFVYWVPQGSGLWGYATMSFSYSGNSVTYSVEAQGQHSYIFNRSGETYTVIGLS